MCSSDLLVEDHKCILWGLEKLVGGEAPRMQVAGSARCRQDAIDGVRRVQPDVVLLDLDLGDENSVDFLPELLEQSPARLLILTGSRNQPLLEQAITLGASGIVLKDESADLVIRAIERVYRGELWLDRATMSRVLGSYTRGGRGQPGPEARQIASLTKKERQIINAIVTRRGAHSKLIADALFMSEHTLRNHLTSIYRKLEVKNRLELVMYALDHSEILDTPPAAPPRPPAVAARHPTACV